ncbi:MAG: hypothetical protein LAO30_02050 [Acidobacteriia bacterium]|nr:hypothetical protein [Terriglobia bacterium]
MKPDIPPAELVEISESDVVELARFIASQSGRESPSVESHLRWFLLDNPARDPQIPFGCGLRLPHGEFVGCILYVPQTFRFQQQTFPVVWSSCFYVDKRYRRNGGLVIFFRFAKLVSRWPLFANSANADAAKFWKVQRAAPIPYSDHELFGVLRWRGMIEEGLRRRGAPQTLARMASAPAALFVPPFKRLKLEGGRPEDLVPLVSAEQVMQLPIHGPAPELTANRDLRYIRWRYFSGRDATVAVFAFRNQQLQSDVLVTVNQRPRGYRGQIRTLNVLDIYPAVKPEVCASIVAALMERYRATVDAIVLRGLDEARQKVFLRRGFMRRQFEAPNGWFLDKSGFLPTRNLYLVPADGDWLI